VYPTRPDEHSWVMAHVAIHISHHWTWLLYPVVTAYFTPENRFEKYLGNLATPNSKSTLVAALQ
jgi:hypothetical protein